MITLDRFKQLMNTEFIKNMLTVHKCDEIVADLNEELHQFNINSERDGKLHNYFIMYHFIRSENDELLISSITDKNYNILIKWNGEKYDLIPYQTNVPFGAIDALLYLMNKAIVYSRANVEAIMRKWICKMQDNPDIAEFSWMDHTKDNDDYEIIIEYSRIPRKSRVYAHFDENGMLKEIRCRAHKGSYIRPSININDNFEDTCWIYNDKETCLRDTFDGSLAAKSLYDMLKNPTDDLDMTDSCHMKEEKVMPKIKVPINRPKQKKKVYPNIFDHRIPGIAGIKDIQVNEKNGNTITTIIWSDKDAKGRNKVTVVTGCATEHPDIETGIAMAIAKRYFGGRNIFKRVAQEANKLNNKRFRQAEHRASVKRKKKGEMECF